MFQEIIQSVVLGITQGLGEFLPISSTAHLILVPYFFHWSDPGLAFDVALHFGTLIAVLVYFWRDWIDIFKLVLNQYLHTKYKLKTMNYNSNLLWFLIIATIPGALAGYFLEDKAETIFRQPLIVAIALSLLGLILYLADRYLKHKKSIQEISWKESLIIGFSQAIAIIPGVSRSGATITTGLLLGLDRISAARFSFLLSTPIILGAAVLKLPTLLKEGVNFGILLAILVAATSGYIAIKYLIKFIEKVSYKIFFWYRLLLAIIIITSVLFEG